MINKLQGFASLLKIIRVKCDYPAIVAMDVPIMSRSPYLLTLHFPLKIAAAQRSNTDDLLRDQPSATASCVHRLTRLTRSVHDFNTLEVETLNLFQRK